MKVEPQFLAQTCYVIESSYSEFQFNNTKCLEVISFIKTMEI
jgi:hypothetical protein